MRVIKVVSLQLEVQAYVVVLHGVVAGGVVGIEDHSSVQVVSSQDMLVPFENGDGVVDVMERGKPVTLELPDVGPTGVADDTAIVALPLELAGPVGVARGPVLVADGDGRDWDTGTVGL